jgi:alcohol dehydrogenase (cytochrome c)
VKRSISLFGTRLYVPTSDAHIVALDMKTGGVIWDQAVADPKAGYRMTGGPLVARGKVMVGTTGRAEGGNIVAALDAETGKEAWRFYTIARPNETGAPSGSPGATIRFKTSRFSQPATHTTPARSVRRSARPV